MTPELRGPGRGGCGISEPVDGGRWRTVESGGSGGPGGRWRWERPEEREQGRTQDFLKGAIIFSCIVASRV